MTLSQPLESLLQGKNQNVEGLPDLETLTASRFTVNRIAARQNTSIVSRAPVFLKKDIARVPQLKRC